MLERDIEKSVIKHAKNCGVVCVKLNDYNLIGLPDRVFFCKGRVMFIEFKSSGGRLTKLQNIIKSKLEAQQFIVHVVNSISQGIDIVDDFVSCN